MIGNGYLDNFIPLFNPPLTISRLHHNITVENYKENQAPTMNPNPTNFPILSYVMERLPTIKLPSAPEFDVENPQEQLRRPVEPQFELAEKMPHLKNPKLISAMRAAVAEVSQTRSTLRALGNRPDHETVDAARFRLSEIGAQASSSSSSMDSGRAAEDYKIYKAVISLDEMHEAYERMLSEAERRLEKIYEAAVAGDEVYDDGMGNRGRELEQDELDEKVVSVLKDVELGKEIDRVDLSGRKLRIFPEAFGRMKSLLVLNLSNNQLEAVPDSIAGLENLEELYLAANLLESLPDSIGLLFKLKILDVSGNKIAALPDSICHCRLLLELDANFNKLTYLPTNIGFELVNLERLSIHLNKIRYLPSSIGDMKSLRILDLHFNQLRGLPPSIGRLTSLETLNLSSNFNDLTELPETIADLASLRELDVSNNQIHELPYGFGRLVSLTKLNLDQNPLVVPPKEVAAKGAEAVKAYMSKRWDEILMEEERKKAREIEEQQAQAQAGLLARSASLLKTYVSNVSEYLGSPKKEGEAYLNQQL